MGLVQGGNEQSMTMAGVTIPLSRAVILRANCGAASKYQTFLLGSANYSVPAGKTLKILAVRCISANTAGSVIVGIGYGDTAVSYSSAAPANYNQLSQGSTVGVLLCPGPGIPVESKINYSVPAGKFPFHYCCGNYNEMVELLCVEE